MLNHLKIVTLYAKCFFPHKTPQAANLLGLVYKLLSDVRPTIDAKSDLCRSRPRSRRGDPVNDTLYKPGMYPSRQFGMIDLSREK